jgi:hypothetical protein
MKTLKRILATSLSLRGLAAAALVFGASAQASHAAATTDPSLGGSFTWDLQGSGNGERGLMFITFVSDGTFHGYQMLAPVPAGTNSPSSGRGVTTGRNNGGNTGRNGSGGTNQATILLFGFGPVNGTWSLDSTGKQVVGVFNELVQVTSVVTNFLAATNTVTLINSQTFETTNVDVVFTNGQATAVVSIDWAHPPPGFTQIYTVDNSSFTTTIGSVQSLDSGTFTATASGTKRLTMVTKTAIGKVSYRGIAAASGTTVDLTGDWAGKRSVNGGRSLNDFFSLVSIQVNNPFPSDFPDLAEFQNVYSTSNGASDETTFVGIAMLSQGKNIGFTFKDADGTLRSMIGTLKPTKFGPTANTRGIQDPLNQVTFSATLQ